MRPNYVMYQLYRSIKTSSIPTQLHHRRVSLCIYLVSWGLIMIWKIRPKYNLKSNFTESNSSVLLNQSYCNSAPNDVVCSQCFWADFGQNDWIKSGGSLRRSFGNCVFNIWSLNNMAAIVQTAFSNVRSWKNFFIQTTSMYLPNGPLVQR